LRTALLPADFRWEHCDLRSVGGNKGNEHSGVLAAQADANPHNRQWRLGKTWLGDQLSSRLSLPLVRLDDVYWAGTYGAEGRPKDEVFRDVHDRASKDAWVMEGVYGWLLPAALPRATEFVFIDLPVAECLTNLRSRGNQGGGSQASFQTMLDWVSEYPNRSNSNSRLTHQRLWDQFVGKKDLLTSREELDRYAGLSNT
jgi:adenylate kinase family enzyme